MNEIISVEHRKAKAMMSEARKFLFRELHSPAGRTHELVEGLNQLSLAFEFVENPLKEVNFCPQCNSFCMEKNRDDIFNCLSCGHNWS